MYVSLPDWLDFVSVAEGLGARTSSGAVNGPVDAVRSRGRSLVWDPHHRRVYGVVLSDDANGSDRDWVDGDIRTWLNWLFGDA